MNKITIYVVSFLLSIFLIVSTTSYNTADAASAKKVTTKKKYKRKRFRLAGCHNLSSSRLNSKAQRFHRTIVRLGKRYRVSPNLIKAVITTESCFRPRARGSSGEKGLMQLMSATGRRFNVRNRYNPAQNIQGGAKYLAYLLRRYGGSKRHAVAAYNTGEGRIRKNGYIPNKAYVYKVMTAYHKFNRSRFSKRRSKGRNHRSKRLKRKSRRSSYIVKPGDSLSKIARRYGLSTKTLIRDNRLKRRHVLKVGSRIYLSKRSKKRYVKRSRGRNKSYRVRRNDSLYKISKRTKVSIKKLRRLNRLRKGQILPIGKRLVLKSKKRRRMRRR